MNQSHWIRLQLEAARVGGLFFISPRTGVSPDDGGAPSDGFTRIGSRGNRVAMVCYRRSIGGPALEVSMHRRVLAVNLVIASMLMASQAAAQETKLDTKTAKERSSRKWFDEQRLDNCRVPVELRGTTPRPGCSSEQTRASVSR